MEEYHMKKVILPCAILFMATCLTNLFAQSFLNLEAFGLKGQVKHHEVIDPEGNHEHYYFNQNGDMTRYWYEGYTYYRNAQLPVDFIYEYSESGKLTRIRGVAGQAAPVPILEISNNKDANEIIVLEYQFRYGFENPNGFNKTIIDSLGRKTSFETWSSKQDMTMQEQYFYNDLGLLAQLDVVINDDGHYSAVSTSYFYDDLGRLMREEHESSDGSSSTLYTYNQAGLLIRESIRDEYNSSAENYVRYKYDRQGRMVEAIRCYDGEECTDKLLSYDVQGNVVSEFDDPCERTHRYEYFR
jgi:YD repeat-containing protein